MKTHLWRQAAAVPVAATLIVGGMVLLATPAVAATGTTSTPSVTTVATAPADPSASAPVTAAPEASAPATAPVTAAPTPTATPTGTPAPVASPTATPTPPVTTPPVTPPAIVKGLAVTSPRSGTILKTRQTVITGAAPTGSTILVADANGSLLGTTKVVTTSFAVPVIFGVQADRSQVVTITGTDAKGSLLAPVVVKLTLPASNVAPITKPVIVTPSNGQKVVGNRLTFSGTGTPGNHIVLLVLKTAAYDALKTQGLSAAKMAAGTTPVMITDDQAIKVRADGTWKISTGVTPLGDYTVIAQSLSGDGITLSPISDPVEFQLVAAVVPAATTVSDDGSGQLAYTGSNSAPIAGLGGALLLGGVALSVVAWRKRRTA